MTLYTRSLVFTVLDENYDVFPVSVGVQYLFRGGETIRPYLISNIAYNFINAKSERTPGVSWSYNSYQDVPEDTEQSTLLLTRKIRLA